MIPGYFTPDGSPYVGCDVALPRLGRRGRVYFLLDTGSDTTILHPSDGEALRCPFDILVNPAEFVGVGGALLYYMEPAVLSFDDTDGSTRQFDMDISIAKPHPITDGLDSLLGRDILNQLDMRYSFPRLQLWFD